MADCTAEALVKSRRLCTLHYHRWWRHGDPTAARDPRSIVPPDVRFDAKWQHDPETGCHVWTAARCGPGYGRFWTGVRLLGAHVYAYERKHGPVPKGLHLDHFVCSNPPCCNPDHLRPVTMQENIWRTDKPTARRPGKTHCVQGHPYDEANTYVYKTGPRAGRVYCRACGRESKQRAAARLGDH